MKKCSEQAAAQCQLKSHGKSRLLTRTGQQIIPIQMERVETQTDACNLRGHCILCVGGLTGVRHQYRQAIETMKGRFLHHDGGREDNLQRLEPMLCSADMVVCASGNISHCAYQLVKQVCKKLGKPCVMVKGTGMASFVEGLQSLSKKISGLTSHAERGATLLKRG